MATAAASQDCQGEADRLGGDGGGPGEGGEGATPPRRVTFDDVLTVLGEFGRHQKILYFLFSFPYVFTSMQLMGWVFVGARLPHRCRLPGEGDAVEFTDRPAHDGCSAPPNATSCDLGYVYDRGGAASNSAAAEWDLVCDRAGLHATAGAAPMAGYLLGGIVLGMLSDRSGRRAAFVASSALLAVAGLGAAASPNFAAFLISRGLAGFAVAGLEGAAFVMGLELVGPSMRTLAGILCWFFETAGLLTALLLAWSLGGSNWRLLQAIYSAPVAVFLLYHWLTPESVRWLLSKGRQEEATRAIRRTAAVNRVELPPGLVEEMEETVARDTKLEEAARTYTTLDLFRRPQTRLKTLSLTLCWVVCSSLYYVLLLSQEELSDDLYAGYFITCAVQIPGYFYVIATLERPSFGRRRSLVGLLAGSGAALAATPFLPAGPVRTGVSVAGRFCANCSYTVLHLYSTELFPTVVRGAGLGFCYVASRLGSVAAPYLLLWFGRLAPCCFGAGALVAAGAAALLPETLGRPLPETMEDGEKAKVVLPSCCCRR